jgi:hypothetical protein
VSFILSRGYFVSAYEEDGIRAFVSPGHSLSQASNFISVRVCPDCFCLGVVDQMSILEEFALFSENGVGHFAEPRHRDPAR